MDEKHLESISKKLDTITKLLAFNLINKKSISEQIEILTKAGLKATDIAELVDRKPNQVYVTQTQLRKKKKEQKDTVEQQVKEDPNV